MPKFERDGSTSVFKMMGHFEPSRAVNPSNGTDPVSLGLMGPGSHSQITTLSGSGAPSTLFEEPTGLPGPAPAPTVPPLVERMEPLPTPVSPPPAMGPPQSVPNMLLLDSGRVTLNGRMFMLPPEVYEDTLAAILAAYEEDVQSELDFYRARMQSPHSARKAVRKTSRARSVVRNLPRKAAKKVAKKPRQPRAKDVLPVLPPAGNE